MLAEGERGDSAQLERHERRGTKSSAVEFWLAHFSIVRAENHGPAPKRDLLRNVQGQRLFTFVIDGPVAFA